MDKELQRVQEVFQSFRRVNQAFFQKLLKAAQPHGITPVQILVLRTLAERPGIGLTELSEHICLSVSTTSGIVGRLEKAGFVARERSKADRRAIRIRMTEAGANVWRRTNETRLAMLRPLLSLSDGELNILLDIHERIVQLILSSGEEPNHETNRNR